MHFFLIPLRASKIFKVPKEFVSKVSKGLLYDFCTKDCAAKWNTKSGLNDKKIFFTFFKFLMSTFLLSIFFSSFVILKIDGFVKTP